MCCVILVACSSKTSPGSTASTASSTPTGGGSSGTSGSSPGVTADSVTVGQVDDLSSPIPGLFKGAEDGTKAYFAYINSLGGVNGRKLKLDAQDSTFQGGQVATATGTQIRPSSPWWAGSRFSTRPRSPLIDMAHVPDVGSRQSRALLGPQSLQPAPQPLELLPAEPLPVPEAKYPQAVKKVGIIWENATASTRRPRRPSKRP